MARSRCAGNAEGERKMRPVLHSSAHFQRVAVLLSSRTACLLLPSPETFSLLHLRRHLFFPHREQRPRAESPAKAVSLPKHFSRTRYGLQAACGQPSGMRVLRGGSRSRVPITEAFPESRTGWDATSGRYPAGLPAGDGRGCRRGNAVSHNAPAFPCPEGAGREERSALTRSTPGAPRSDSPGSCQSSLLSDPPSKG